MTTEEMTCTDMLERLGRLRQFHQGRADSAAALEKMMRSVVEEQGVGALAGPGTGIEHGAEPGESRGTGGVEAGAGEAGGTGGKNGKPELGDISVDFTGADNLRERVKRVALATAAGTPLSPTVVTRFLIESGQHSSKLINPRSSVYQVFRRHPELYRRVGDGCFEIIRADDAPEVSP